MKKIIFISYSYLPCKTVGVLRLSYWFQYLKTRGYNVILITAENSDKFLEDSIIRLPQDNSKFDNSFKWGFKVKEYILRNIHLECGDTILMTGGPFLQFWSIINLKQFFPGIKILTDYRDPLTHNPRNKSLLKYCFKYFLERYVNKRSDVIITVNSYCEQMLVSAKNTYIIDNGYDERYFSDISFIDKECNSLAYAGKFYDDTEPINLLNALSVNKKIKFYYIGPDKRVKTNGQLYNLGFRDYAYTTNILKRSEIGIVLTGGRVFESTTKIFDYIGARMKILVITEGNLYDGNIYEITKDNPNVIWCKNNVNDISYSINILLSRSYIPIDETKFTREEGAKLLERLL